MLEVLIRISKIDYKRDTVEGAFLDCITQYNNTQNAIRLPDFRSNDGVQKDLRRHFGKITLAGKRFLYKNRRERVTPRDKVPVSMEEFTKSIHAFEIGPADYFGGTSYLFDPSPNGGYAKVFGDGVRVNEYLETDDLKQLAGTWFVCDTVKDLFLAEKRQLLEAEYEAIEAKERDTPVVKEALERRYLAFFTVGEIFRAKHKDKDVKAILRKLGDPKWTLERGSTEVRNLESYTCFACDIIVDVFEQSSRNSGFTHRDFYRNKRYLDDIRAKVTRSRTALASLETL